MFSRTRTASRTAPAPTFGAVRPWHAEWFHRGVFRTSGTFHAPDAGTVEQVIRNIGGDRITVTAL